MEAVYREAKGWILIAEDNPGDISLIRMVLKQHGIERKIVVMKDGERACKFLDEADAQNYGSPALIVLDLNLPKKSGREVLEQVRRSIACKHAPVVVFSSSSADADRRDVLRLGADRFVTKPSDLDEFFKVGELFKGLIEGH